MAFRVCEGVVGICSSIPPSIHPSIEVTYKPHKAEYQHACKVEDEVWMCAQAVSFTDTGTASGVNGGGLLPAGVYNALSAGYTGGTANGITFSAASSSASGLPAGSFQVLPVRGVPSLAST